MADREHAEVGGIQMTRGRVAIVVAVAIAVAVIVWLLASGDNNSSVKRVALKALTPQQLADQASKLGRPIYWAGPRPGTTYEYTETSSGNVYVRYLPKGTRL